MLISEIYLSFAMSYYAYILLGIALVMATIIIIWCVRRYGRVVNAISKEDSLEESHPASIIVYSCDDSERLRQLLPVLLSQDYSLFEVIVVDDSCTDATKDLLLEMSIDYNNLYYTFIPDGTLNLSRKKLSLTLGVKAAKYDIVLTTTSNCCPTSDQWLKCMMRNFDASTDVVIGYSHIDHDNDERADRYYRSFDEVVNAVQYLSYALCGKPYRGDGNNLAYRKELFFRHKGFSRSLNLHYGDDDLFVNEISNSYNTKVELSPQSQMVVNYNDPVFAYKELKLRYDFTFRYIPTFAKTSSSLVTLMRIIFILVSGVAIYLEWLNMIPIIAIIVLILGIWTTEIIMYRKVARILGGLLLGISVPLFVLLRPIVNLRYKILNDKYKKSNYTWQRKKPL